MKLKNKKGISLIVLILIIVAIIVICGVGIAFFLINKYKNKEPITASEFKEKMENDDYEVFDVTNQNNLYEFIENAYVALKEKNKYQIEFYITDKEENAVFLFNNNKRKIEEYKTAKYSETKVDIGNNSKYTLTTEDTYKAISRIGNTMIYANVDKEYKEKVKEILEELGY